MNSSFTLASVDRANSVRYGGHRALEVFATDGTLAVIRVHTLEEADLLEAAVADLRGKMLPDFCPVCRRRRSCLTGPSPRYCATCSAARAGAMAEAPAPADPSPEVVSVWVLEDRLSAHALFTTHPNGRREWEAVGRYATRDEAEAVEAEHVRKFTFPSGCGVETRLREVAVVPTPCTVCEEPTGNPGGVCDGCVAEVRP